MRIIYGLSGQGFGHSARAKEIIKHLIDAGHELKIFTYGQALLLLQKEFGEDKIYEIPGLVLSYKKNQVVYWKTIWENAKKITGSARYWNKLSHAFSDFNPNLVITDFEPLSVILARTKDKPLISIDNQHQLTNTTLKLSSSYRKDLLTARLIIKSMVWGARHYLITSFYATPIKRKNTFLFAPVIRKEVQELQPTNGDYILVYQGAEFSHLLPILRRLKEKFVVFGPHQESEEGNIIFKGFAVEEWLNYLANARAVIGTARLSLMCECIYLKKPYLAMPIGRQIEQILNAQYLQRLGYGMFTEDFCLEDFEEFIRNLDHYRSHLAGAHAFGNDELCKKLDEIVSDLNKK